MYLLYYWVGFMFINIILRRLLDNVRCVWTHLPALVILIVSLSQSRALKGDEYSRSKELHCDVWQVADLVPRLLASIHFPALPDIIYAAAIVQAPVSDVFHFCKYGCTFFSSIKCVIIIGEYFSAFNICTFFILDAEFNFTCIWEYIFILLHTCPFM